MKNTGTAKATELTTKTPREKCSTGCQPRNVLNKLEPIMMHTMKTAKMSP